MSEDLLVYNSVPHRKRPKRAFDRGVAIAAQMLERGNPSPADVRAALEELLRQNDPEEVQGFCAAVAQQSGLGAM